jgi:CxxC motif-containing protein (DUF1111 family)
VGTDDGVGPCVVNNVRVNEIQDDVHLFAQFMTFLAPAPKLPLDNAINQQASAAFLRAGCDGCHTPQEFRTPASPANGVPGNFAFKPFSDFLVHDMGSLGDMIGNDGDSVAVTRRMRTAPLWGIRFRTALLHDGSAPNITEAVRRHAGQAATSANAFFNVLSASDRAAIITALNTI